MCEIGGITLNEQAVTTTDYRKLYKDIAKYGLPSSNGVT